MKWIYAIILVLATAVLTLVLVQLFPLLNFLNSTNNSQVSIQQTVLQSLTPMAKIELTKCQVQQYIKEVEVRPFYLPDSVIGLLISGEAVGCLDLSKIKSEHIKPVKENQLEIQMPGPELCYAKINFGEAEKEILITKFSTPELQHRAYKRAEDAIRVAVVQQLNIYEQTEKFADLILRPLLEKITGKAVQFRFPERLNNEQLSNTIQFK